MDFFRGFLERMGCTKLPPKPKIQEIRVEKKIEPKPSKEEPDKDIKNKLEDLKSSAEKLLQANDYEGINFIILVLK